MEDDDGEHDRLKNETQGWEGGSDGLCAHERFFFDKIHLRKLVSQPLGSERLGESDHLFRQL